MFIYAYECDACSFRGDARRGQIGFYVFPDGERMPASTSVAWCRECNGFTSAEDLPTVDAILQEITRLQKNQTNDFDVEVAQMLDEELGEYVSSRLVVLTKLDYRFRARQAANRCIECGTTDFDYLGDDRGAMPQELPHADCRGKLRLVETLHGIPSTYFTLDAEGNRIPASNAT